MASMPLWVTAGLWLVFVAYWSAAAKNAAPNAKTEPLRSRQVHLLMMYGSLVLVLCPWFGVLRWRWLPLWPGWSSVGLGVQVAAGSLAVWARRHLGRNWSGAVTVKVGHELVCTGPYRCVRHPIYTGVLGMFLGSALVWGEAHALIGLALITFAYVRKVRLEEQNMLDLFGERYTQYRRSSWALIPGLV